MPKSKMGNALLLSAALLAGLSGGWLARRASEGRAGCHVLDVIDGDTLRIERRGVAEVVRLLCVDAPERGEAGYAAAKAELEELTASGTVRLEGERPDGLLARDVYGRLLAYVWAGDRLVNLELVRSGRAVYWVRYGKGRHAGAFVAAVAQAR